MKVITLQNKRYTITSQPKPVVRPDTVLVRTVAYALNPSDTKTPVEGGAPDGTFIGCDTAGFVEEIGPNATRQFKKGDRVAGFVVGNGIGRHDEGAFAEYALMKTGAICKIPENLSFTDAVTLGVGIATVALSLYQSLQLPLLPTVLGSEDARSAGKTLLVHGGNTATGSLSIQFAKLSGWNVVTTCSPPNFDRMKSLGADATFDYSSPSCGSDINKYTSNTLQHVHDCIGTRASAVISDAALASSSSPYSQVYYCPLLPMRLPNREEQSIEGGFVLAYTTGGESTRCAGVENPARPQDYDLVKQLWQITEKLLVGGRIKPRKPEVRTGGLRGVLMGLDDLRDGTIRGRKLVYKI